VSDEAYALSLAPAARRVCRIALLEGSGPRPQVHARDIGGTRAQTSFARSCCCLSDPEDGASAHVRTAGDFHVDEPGAGGQRVGHLQVQAAFLRPRGGGRIARARDTGRASYRGPGRRRATPVVSNRALGRDASREPGRLAPWPGRAVAVLVLLGVLVEGTPANGKSRYITNR
jgi:hypothetical protein